jgi:uncharacterized OB-fold protein
VSDANAQANHGGRSHDLRFAAVPEPVAHGLFTHDGLLGGGCGACGKRHFPRGATCPWCGADDVSEVMLSPDGTLWGWTAVLAAPPGYEGDVPYGFGVVELPADGIQVVTRLTEADPSRLHEGMAVRFTVVALTADTTTWAFAPV